MAEPSITGRLLILLGDGATPTEDFGHPCGANARSVTLTNNLGEQIVLDCDDPLDQPAIIVRWPESQDTAVSITGTVAKESFATWRAWADNQTRKNIRIVLDEDAADGGGYWLLPAYLATLELGAEGKGTATFTATITAAGKRVWTAAT